jgi:hypothetical protein
MRLCEVERLRQVGEEDNRTSRCSQWENIMFCHPQESSHLCGWFYTMSIWWPAIGIAILTQGERSDNKKTPKPVLSLNLF